MDLMLTYQRLEQRRRPETRVNFSTLNKCLGGSRLPYRLVQGRVEMAVVERPHRCTREKHREESYGKRSVLQIRAQYGTGYTL